MSSPLFCWKKEPGAEICPEALIESLEDLESHPGLAFIPVAELAAAFRREFGDVREQDGNLSWESEQDGRFDAVPLLKSETLASLVPVYCSKGQTIRRRVAAVAASLGCCVFDVQQA